MTKPLILSLALLTTPFAAYAADSDAVVADRKLSQEIVRRLMQLNDGCNCACLKNVQTLYDTRVLLRETNAGLPDLGTQGAHLAQLRQDKNCNSGGSARSPFSAKPKARTVVSIGNGIGGTKGNTGTTKSERPDAEVTAEELWTALNTFDAGVRDELVKSATRQFGTAVTAPADTSKMLPLLKRSTGTKRPFVIDVLEKLQPAEQKQFVNALPAGAELAIRDYVKEHPSTAIALPADPPAKP